MDPLKQQQLTMPVVEVFLAIEEQILINIAKRLKKHKGLFDEDIHSWQVQKLSELGALTQQNIIMIAKYARLSIDEVTKMLEQAGYTTVQEYEGDLQEAVQLGLAIQPPTGPEVSTSLQAILSAYQAQAMNTFNLVNTTLIQQAEQAYLDIVNQTVGKVLAGVQTPREALREVAAKWANDGIPALIDKAGRKWSTEGYLSMIARTMSNNIANDMQDARMAEYGVDLIEVSSHMGARPKCAPYQGRIFSLSGTSDKYPPFSSTSYGQPDGLFGINCRHVKYPFIPGITKQRFKPYDAEKNRKAYEESQQQRYLERQIRKAKREYNMMEALHDKEGMKKAREKVLQAQENMREFFKQTGRTRNRSREQLALNNPRISGSPSSSKKETQNSKTKSTNPESSNNPIDRFVKVRDRGNFDGSKIPNN
ncbi:protein gp4 [Bacillus methanolicus PB1]|uniref:Protein gp4 n=1 Tax=Bacillus methanolicus PB1 TaxID=997296 RepID=I3DY01_BACMT|nr:phage minor capsid protein [Bacillus methanolicus]EIJ79122.1 protein gp4 [Bacillus methanolicus PB1]